MYHLWYAYAVGSPPLFYKVTMMRTTNVGIHICVRGQYNVLLYVGHMSIILWRYYNAYPHAGQRACRQVLGCAHSWSHDMPTDRHLAPRSRIFFPWNSCHDSSNNASIFFLTANFWFLLQPSNGFAFNDSLLRPVLYKHT